MADVSCVALNHLPPRYIRQDVDMSFFMSPVEREETAKKVQEAVNLALKFVLKHEQEKMNANKESDDKAEANEDLNAIAPEEDKEDSNDSDPAH
jgi:hypothetical protein